jgi:carbon storage regulator CsrA
MAFAKADAEEKSFLNSRRSVMLVLTRKAGQSVVIGDVVVRVGDLHRGRVKLAIDAPSGVSVLRGELVQSFDNDPDLTSKPADWLVPPNKGNRKIRMNDDAIDDSASGSTESHGAWSVTQPCRQY